MCSDMSNADRRKFYLETTLKVVHGYFPRCDLTKSRSDHVID